MLSQGSVELDRYCRPLRYVIALVLIVEREYDPARWLSAGNKCDQEMWCKRVYLVSVWCLVAPNQVRLRRSHLKHVLQPVNADSPYA